MSYRSPLPPVAPRGARSEAGDCASPDVPGSTGEGGDGSTRDDGEQGESSAARMCQNCGLEPISNPPGSPPSRYRDEDDPVRLHYSFYSLGGGILIGFELIHKIWALALSTRALVTIFKQVKSVSCVV